jgi:LmbE family N-acetylglucosaminyl deacetylase
MLMSEIYVPSSAMVIMAHPDDIEYTCAGTLAWWIKSNTKVSFVLCTSGEVGIDIPGMTKEKAREIREREQLDASQIIGAVEVIFLREPDGILEPSINLRKKLVREIRRFKPEVIMCGDPTIIFASMDYINHPDHRAAAIAALDATFPAAGQPHLFEDLEREGLKAHKPRKVYVAGWNQSDIYIRIDETIDIKVSALRAHKSQMGDEDPEPMIKEWAADCAKGREMNFAESFRVISLVSDADWQNKHLHNG